MPLRYDLDDDGVLRRPADDLRRLVRYQRWVMGVVLAQIALWIGFLLLSLVRGDSIGDGLGFPVTVTVVLGCVGGIFAFLIYCTARNPVIALVMGAACIPPFLGLLALTVVNGVATRALEADGVLVGMFGADADAVEDVPGLYDEQDGW
jgi:hypothetical protein